MTEAENEIAPYHARFIAMLDAEFERFGAPDGLPAPLRDAVVATPRHRFVHRFRLGEDSPPLLDFDADPSAFLATVYSDQVLRHAGPAGEPLASSNSQPSYILWLLHLLDLRPGQHVLEIGSGSGWLAAIMARLVGPAGHITGAEIIPSLADQSRADLAAAGIENITISTQDGTQARFDQAPFDRVMITAATWSPPAALLGQVADGGCILVPLEFRGGDGCCVSVLRRNGDRFVAERQVIGWFVPLQGASQQRPSVHRSLETLPFWPDIGRTPTVRVALPLGGPLAWTFRAFLSCAEPGFAIFASEPPKQHRGPAEPLPPFGLIDEAAQSVAVWSRGKLLSYGPDSAARRFVRAYATWVNAGLPRATGLDLELVPSEAEPPSSDHLWPDPRGGITLLWRLKADAHAWRELLG
jgi:protein-L-isoaspartate(D-aspartate) O-methyltransferase